MPEHPELAPHLLVADAKAAIDFYTRAFGAAKTQTPSVMAGVDFKPRHYPEGNTPRRVIVPADAPWDDFFEAPSIELGEREQLQAEAGGA